MFDMPIGETDIGFPYSELVERSAEKKISSFPSNVKAAVIRGKKELFGVVTSESIEEKIAQGNVQLRFGDVAEKF